MWITIAFILATFDITPALDKNGQPILVKLVASSGVISCVHFLFMCEHDFDFFQFRHPLPFKCSIKPRSYQAKILIQQANLN